MDFYDTRMGRTFFEHQVPQLIQAIQALTATLEKPSPAAILPVEPDPEFLSGLYYGNYQPGIFEPTPETRRFTRAVNKAHAALEETLSGDSHEKLQQYEDILAQRDSADLERAYESGFRTAVQMIAAGLSQPVIRQDNGTRQGVH